MSRSPIPPELKNFLDWMGLTAVALIGSVAALILLVLVLAMYVVAIAAPFVIIIWAIGEFVL